MSRVGAPYKVGVPLWEILDPPLNTLIHTKLAQEVSPIFLLVVDPRRGRELPTPLRSEKCTWKNYGQFPLSDSDRDIFPMDSMYINRIISTER